MLTCKDAPAVPGPKATQVDLVPFDALLGAAWKDCYGNLGAVRTEIERQREELSK